MNFIDLTFQDRFIFMCEYSKAGSYINCYIRLDVKHMYSNEPVIFVMDADFQNYYRKLSLFKILFLAFQIYYYFY